MIDEGDRLEREAAYAGEDMQAVRDAEAAGGQLPEVDLSVEYLRGVRKVSDNRFVAAGVRLGRLLK